MNNIDIFRLTLGLLQFGVAGYALRLGRLFKSTLAGWLFFGALTLLALLSFFLAVEPLDAGAQWGIKVDIVYTVLLLAGLTRFYPGFKNLLYEEGAKRRSLEKWELQVKEQWVELIKANEKLRQTVNQLEMEVAEQKRELAKNNLQALPVVPAQNGKDVSSATNGTHTEVIGRIPAPKPAPAEKNSEQPPLVSPKNGEESLPVVAAGFDTAIILQKPEPESAEPNGERPRENGGELRPAIAGFDTAITFQKSKPAPEPVEQNGEPPPTTPRESPEESWQAVCVPDRKTAVRKPAGTNRKKPAKSRSTPRARGQKPRSAPVPQFGN